MDALQALKLALQLERWRRRRGKQPMGSSPLPDGMTVFENSLCFAVADNNHIIWAGLTKTHNGIAVWKDQTILFVPESETQDWGQPHLEWRLSDGALLVSSCEKGGTIAWVWKVEGVSKESG
jgi:hypothetical protein